jgi:sarcosine oxidase subunit beta
MNGLGVTLAPAVGAYLADAIAGDATDADVDAYLSPARFS